MRKPLLLIKALLTHLLRSLLKGRIKSKRISGSKMVLHYDKSQHLMFLGKKKIRYEKNIQHKLSGLIKFGDLIFDIGANIGQYTLFFSEGVGPDGHVVSVEPGKDNFKMLRFNVESNGCSNITTINAGIAAEEGDRVLYLDTLTGGRKSSFFAETMGKNYEGKSENVPVMGFGSLLERFGTPDLVKIDVEGAESDVMNGIKSFSVKTIFLVEVSDTSKNDILERFTKENYQCYCAESADFKLIEGIEGVPDGINNFLFMPSARLSER